MKTVKNVLAVLFVVLFVVTLTACGGDYGSNQTSGNNDNANSNTRYQPE